jgi:iron complex outermembrane receptor protein
MGPRRILVAAGWFALTTSSLLWAQPPATQPAAPSSSARTIDDIDEVSLDELLGGTISIASGRLQRPEEAPAIVSVITDDEIRRRGARTLDEVLQTIPGFEVLTDSVGRSRITVRGVAESANVLILFNGQRLGEATSGSALLVNVEIPLHNIRRIEVIRGPGSALYGTSAFTAVINLVSYSAPDFHGVRATVGGGTFGTQEYSAILGRNIGSVGLAASLQFVDAAGPDLPILADRQTVRDVVAGTRFSLAPGQAGTSSRSLDAAANVSIGTLRIDGRFRSEKRDGYVGIFDILGSNNRLNNAQWLVAATDQRRLGDHWTFTPRASFTQSRLGARFDALPPGFAQPTPFRDLVFPDGLTLDTESPSRRFAADGTLEHRTGQRSHEMFGASYEREWMFDVKTAANFDLLNFIPLPTLQPTARPHLRLVTRRIASIFGQEIFNAGRLGITAGVRLDHYSDFGTAANPRAAVVWRLPSGMYVKALYGEAFRAPSFLELYFDTGGFFEGDRNLRPQKLRTQELALVYTRRRLRLSGDYFHSSTRNLIVPATAVSAEALAATTRYVNTPGFDAQGVELELERGIGIDEWLTLNYTFQRPRDRATHLRAPDVPSHLANGAYTKQFGHYITVTPVFQLRGERPRDRLDPRPPYPAYALLNLNVRVKNVWNTLEVALTVNNLFDKRYASPSGVSGIPGDYPRSGRAVFLRAKYKL